MSDFNPNLRTHAAPPGLLDRALLRSQRPSPWRDSRLLVAAAFLCGIGIGFASGTFGNSSPAAPPTATVLPVAIVGPPPPQSPALSLVPVRFVLPAPGASTVSLAGTWNDWSETAQPLIRGEGDVFYLVVPLAPGQYEYQFVVDGQRWQPDPAAPLARDDGFGQRNSVLTI